MPKPRAKTSPALLAKEKQQAKTAKTEQAKQKKQQQQQPAAKASNKYSSSAKPKTADLPIHCETCEQPYGSNDKDALPEQRPLKWRSFNIKQIQQDIVGPRLPWESTWEAL